jgi:hypothetical protein
MFEHVALYILSAVVAFGIAFVVGKWLFGESQEVQARRKAAGQMAGVCSAYGLTVVPELLIDYSTGDYVNLVETFYDFVKATLKDETTLVTELNSVFSAVLDKQLATPAGLALVQAKIAALSAPSTSTTVAAPATAVAK